jgi:hypothetical protein
MIAGAVMAAVVVLCSLASSAGAKVIYSRALHQKIGIFPSPAALPSHPPSARSRLAASGTPTCDPGFEPDCASLLTNVGSGPVQHAEKDFLFFWGPSSSFPSNYVSGMQSFLSGLQAGDYSPDHTATSVGNPLSVVQQYYDHSGPGGTKRFIPLAIQNAGTIMDTNAYPSGTANGMECTDTYNTYNPTTCLTASDLENELTSYIAAHHSPTGINVEYFIMLPPGVGTCDDNTSTSCAMAQYCAWHTATTTGSTATTLANMPYLAGTPCDAVAQFGISLNNDGTDSVAATFSHELAETMTDPLLNAWQGSGGGGDEIGDKCAYQYAVGQSTAGPPPPGSLPTQNNDGHDFFNTTLSGRNSLLQMEFDDSANSGTGGCNQWDTQTQPTASISAPSSVARRTPVTFSLTSVHAPPGVAYVTWNFGDGTTKTTIGTAAARHTYAAAGKRIVTAILTDKHGNELKKTKLITVKI